MPGAKEHVVRADSARPETISYLRRHGFSQIRGAVKWKESVKEGINWLRALQRIVIHERCTKTAEEARLWSYKVDKITSDVLPDVVDKHNHYWDSIRYALEPIIRVRKWGVVK